MLPKKFLATAFSFSLVLGTSSGIFAENPNHAGAYSSASVEVSYVSEQQLALQYAADCLSYFSIKACACMVFDIMRMSVGTIPSDELALCYQIDKLIARYDSRESDASYHDTFVNTFVGLWLINPQFRANYAKFCGLSSAVSVDTSDGDTARRLWGSWMSPQEGSRKPRGGMGSWMSPQEGSRKPRGNMGSWMSPQEGSRKPRGNMGSWMSPQEGSRKPRGNMGSWMSPQEGSRKPRGNMGSWMSPQEGSRKPRGNMGSWMSPSAEKI